MEKIIKATRANKVPTNKVPTNQGSINQVPTNAVGTTKKNKLATEVKTLPQIQLLKMHGAKNYFVIYDARINKYQAEYTDLIKKISNFHSSVASSDSPDDLYFDQFIVIDFAKNQKANCFMRIFNQDLSEVNACGNATRCIAKVIMAEESLNSCIIQTNSGLLCAHKSGEDIVVNMGVPKLGWHEIPLSYEIEDTQALPIEFSYQKYHFKNPSAINMGNPHCVFVIEDSYDLSQIPIEKFGSELENHPIFPERANINFVKVKDYQNIELRVFERGVGETLACGTGACASFVAACRKKLIGNSANIHLKGGTLKISTNKRGEILMQGSVSEVKKLTLELPS